jgi:hypothetical protein
MRRVGCALALRGRIKKEDLPAKLIFALAAAKENVIRHNSVRL